MFDPLLSSFLLVMWLTGAGTASVPVWLAALYMLTSRDGSWPAAANSPPAAATATPTTRPCRQSTADGRSSGAKTSGALPLHQSAGLIRADRRLRSSYSRKSQY